MNTQARTICPGGYLAKNRILSHKKTTRKVERHCFYVIVRQYFIVLALCENFGGTWAVKNSQPILETFRF